MESNTNTLVIKAKYGDILRRLNAGVNEDGQLDLNLNGLRSKIIALFSFPTDADLMLTYMDEDGDMVALVDDDDLRDVMRQRLKFLRVDIKLKNDKSSKYGRSSGTSTPISSPRIPNSLPNFNAGVAEVLKTVPEPLRDALSKLSADLASKAASSSPVVAELVEAISNLSQSFQNSIRQSQLGEDVSFQTATPNVSTAPSGPSVPIVDNKSGMQEGLPKSNSTTQNVRAVAAEAPASGSVDLNVHPSQASDPCGLVNVNCPPTSSNAPATGDAKETKKEDAGNPNGASVGFEGFVRGRQSNCPFGGMPMANDSAVPLSPHMNIFKRGRSGNDAVVGIFHRGVQCDGCGAHPIAGPRYKSLVKEDYDLCSVCFAEMGNNADYFKIERPMTHRHPHCLKGPRHPHHWAPPLSHIVGTWGSKPGKFKLDSRFVMDVNVFDGTVMPPSTPFTKIWRMCNNGTVAWPKGTRLVWIGGGRFSHANFVELEITEDGIPSNGALDVAVDFVSPELPGRYISYWSMASPSGTKFGQRVWVLIQVDASLKDTLSEGFQDLNLNLPPESSGLKVPETVDVNVHPGGVSNFEPFNYTSFSAPNPMAYRHPNKDQEVSLPINDASTVAHGFSGAAPVPSPAPISAPAPVVAQSSVPLAAVPGYASLDAIFGPIPARGSSSVSVPVTHPTLTPPVPSQAPPTTLPVSVPLPAHSSVLYPIIDWPELPPVGFSQPHPAAHTSATLSEKVADRASAFVPYPTVDWSELAQAGLPKPVPAKDVSTSSEKLAVDDAVEESLLKELDDMGFKQVDLNKEVLRNNGYDLEQSVDALCGVSEWDPILEELQEMGFSDKEMNKKLLEKNNGSIKLVVMDLLRGKDKDARGKDKDA